ncbi:MAG: NACHT domain-containing protein [Cyanobacteria bacterium P01_F01_bin.150]
MPKLSYGPAAKQRVAYLFTVLLDYANDELEMADAKAEEQLERLRSHLSIHWEGDRSLIVRTKLRYLAKLSSLAPGEMTLTTGQIKDGFKYLEQFLGILDDNRASRRGSDTWHFTLTLWSQRWDRDGNLQQLERQWDDRRTSRSKRQQNAQHAHGQEEGYVNPSFRNRTRKGAPEGAITVTSDTNQDDFWQTLCHRDLEQQQRTHLTTNPITSQDGLRFTLAELYVPLNVVQRSENTTDLFFEGKTTQRETTVDQESDETPLISSQELFTYLQRPMVNRVAIVGEPGAGKTTLLQQLAHWVLEQTNDLPIWISLADVEQQSLEDYILQTWLRQALGQYQVELTTVTEFVEQVTKRRVWLFLDAVDEMALPSSMVLTRLAKQMAGWLAQTKIILTCRQNIWDGGKNALTQFETYECCAFSPCESLETFIRNWFFSTPALAEQLWQILNQNQLRQIKSLVKNPLRLALLCRIWSVGQGQLPTTKTQLYGQFVDAIYVWKQDYFPLSLTQQYQLNQALGDLALSAMMQAESPFRFPKAFVYQVFQGHRLELLDLALQLGWLKSMGRSPQTQESSYGFSHGSFQEYFAAQSLSSWPLFWGMDPTLDVASRLRRSLGNCPSDRPVGYGANPLIFKRQWREVFLRWLGRADIANDDKCALLDSLIQFEDQAGGFFAQRAYFLAARGLAEFPDYPQAEALARQLVQWGFSADDVPVPIREGARRALAQTDQGWAIAVIKAFLDQSTHTFERWTAAYSLGKNYEPGNSKAIATLETIIEEINNPHLQMNVARGLGVIDPRNAKAIDTLMALLSGPKAVTQLSVEQSSAEQSSAEQSSAGQSSAKQLSAKAAEFSCKVALRLGQVDPGNKAAIAILVTQIDTLDSEFQKKRAYQALAQISPDHPYLQQFIPEPLTKPLTTRLSHSPQSRPSLERLMGATLAKLEELTQEYAQEHNPRPDRYWHQCLRLAIRLDGYRPGHQRAIAIYLDCLRYAQQKSLLKQTFGQLQRLDEEQIRPVFSMVRDLYKAGAIVWDTNSEPDYRSINRQKMEKIEVERSRFYYRLLWEWADTLGYQTFCNLWQN